MTDTIKTLRDALEALEDYKKGTQISENGRFVTRVCCGTPELTRPHHESCKAVQSFYALRTLIATMEAHDNGQSLEKSEPFKYASAIPTKAGQSLPLGEYALYAAPVQPVEQPSNDFDIRGKLSTLKCWHRLTGEEAAELVALVASVQPVEQPKAEPCTWHQIDDTHMPGTWDADCGAMWTFTDGGPVENDMRYCPKCGKPVAQEGGAA